MLTFIENYFYHSIIYHALKKKWEAKLYMLARYLQISRFDPIPSLSPLPKYNPLSQSGGNSFLECLAIELDIQA